MYISQQLVDLIERNADELSKKWLEDVRARPETKTYRKFDPDELYSRVHEVYSQLGKWISHETTKKDIREHYISLGAKRLKEGFALSEVIMALTITRRYIWLKILSDGFLDTALDLRKAIELNNRVILFFDRAIYYTAKGFEKERD